MKVNRKTLLDALNLASPGLATKELIAQSMSFVFSGDRVFTYNDEIAVSHPVPEGIQGAGVVRAAELMKLLNKSVDEEIDVIIADNSIILEGKKFKTTLKRSTEIVLPLQNEVFPEVWDALPPGFGEAVRFVLFSASKDMTKPALTCVHAFGNRVETCDNYRATVRYFDNKEGSYFKEPLMIPASAAAEVPDYEFEGYTTQHGWIHFRTKEGTVFSCRTFMNLKYPDIREILKVEGPMLKFPDDMKNMLSRASIFSAKKIKSDEVVRVSIADGFLTIIATGEIGSHEEKDRVRFTGKKAFFLIAPSFFEAVLKITDSAVVGESMLLFEDKDFTHVVCLCGEK